MIDVSHDSRQLFPTSRKRRAVLIIIFILALVLRLAVFTANSNQVGYRHVLDNCFDCTLYMDMARAVITGEDNSELGFYHFGPGYACFLASNILILGDRPALIIIINIIISSFVCVLIYLLAMFITRSYAISTIAAFLSAVSYTSIMLANYIMSDTLFLFVFLLAFLLYLKALFSGKWTCFVLAGIFTAAAILIRSIGQFWPLVMIFFAAAYMMRKRLNFHDHRYTAKEIIAKVFVSIAIILVVMSIWIIRNNRIHGVPTTGFTSVIGPANVVAVTVERLDGTLSNDVLWGWVDDYRRANNKTKTTLGEVSEVYLTQASRMADSLGWEVYKTYFMLLWENLNTVCFLHRYLVPEYNIFMIPLEGTIKAMGFQYLCFILSMIGLVLLFIRRRFFPAIILATTYIYFASLIGSFRWQGTRYFFPGQIAWTIMIAVVIVFLGWAAKWAYCEIRNRFVSI